MLRRPRQAVTFSDCASLRRCSRITPACAWSTDLRVSNSSAAGLACRGLASYSARVRPSGSCTPGMSIAFTTTVRCVSRDAWKFTLPLKPLRSAALWSRKPSVSKCVALRFQFQSPWAPLKRRFSRCRPSLPKAVDAASTVCGPPSAVKMLITPPEELP